MYNRKESGYNSFYDLPHLLNGYRNGVKDFRGHAESFEMMINDGHELNSVTPITIHHAKRLDKGDKSGRDRTYYIQDEHREGVLKLFGHPKPKYRKFLVNKILNIHTGFDRPEFRLPAILDTDENNWILFESLQRQSGCPITEAEVSRILSGLLRVAPPKNLTPYRDVYGHLMIRMLSRLLYRPIPMSWHERLQITANLMYCHYLQSALDRPFFVHTDLHRDNILKTRSGLYLLDLQTAVFEHRWMLIDVSVFALQESGFSINTHYLKTIQKEALHLFPDSPINWYAQLYTGMMFYFLKVLGPRLPQAQVPPLVSFIRKNMLSWKRFRIFATHQLF